MRRSTPCLRCWLLLSESAADIRWPISIDFTFAATQDVMASQYSYRKLYRFRRSLLGRKIRSRCCVWSRDRIAAKKNGVRRIGVRTRSVEWKGVGVLSMKSRQKNIYAFRGHSFSLLPRVFEILREPNKQTQNDQLHSCKPELWIESNGKKSKIISISQTIAKMHF